MAKLCGNVVSHLEADGESLFPGSFVLTYCFSSKHLPEYSHGLREPRFPPVLNDNVEQLEDASSFLSSGE